MAVTNFSPLLGLALPTTGDLSGTWGTTVNDSITGLIDSAVAGTTTLSTDADVTLSTTNGSANQARNAVLLCTGARTSIKTITAPAQSKAYIVINNTTGGYAVKLVGAGPTTGIAVLPGFKALVAWDGSDFVIVSSGLISATASTSAELQLYEAINNGTSYVALKAPTSLAATTTYILPAVDGTANQSLLTDGAGTLSWGGVTGASINTYASSSTWTKPAGITTVTVELWGGGGGGGSGRRTGSSTRGGGGGGGGGGCNVRTFSAASLPSTVSITLGAGGTGGAAVTSDSTDGNAGANGSNSTFGTYLTAFGGGGGSGGTSDTQYTTNGGGGAGTTSAGSGVTQGVPDGGNGTISGGITAAANFGGGGGGFAYFGNPGSGGAATNGGPGGGCGGTVNSFGTIYNGGTGGSGVPNAGGTGGSGAPGGDGVDRAGGGGGGTSSTSGYVGGAGSIGGGGGGGGSSASGYASGAGGVGGAGYCRITTT